MWEFLLSLLGGGEKPGAASDLSGDLKNPFHGMAELFSDIGSADPRPGANNPSSGVGFGAADSASGGPELEGFDWMGLAKTMLKQRPSEAGQRRKAMIYEAPQMPMFF